MSFKVRFTEEAQDDIERFYEFLLQREDADLDVAQCALDAIAQSLVFLEHTPFSCRKAISGNTFLRELVIPFGRSGYVALSEIDDATTVTVIALRHQREEDFH